MGLIQIGFKNKNIMKKIFVVITIIIALFFVYEIGAQYFPSFKIGDELITDSLSHTTFRQPIIANGVLLGAGGGGGGGGDAYLANNQTFTGKNTFSNGTYHTDSLNVLGAITVVDSLKIREKLILSKAANQWMQKLNAFALYFGTNSDTAFEIDASNQVHFLEQTFFEDVELNNLTASNTVTTDLTVYNETTSNSLNVIGSATVGSISGDGNGLTNVNATTLQGVDTTKLVYTNRADTLTSPHWFSGVMKFLTNVVDFAAGITTTTLTANSTSTFNGDMVNNGWRTQGGIARDKYFRDTVLRAPSVAVSNNITIAHGIPNINSIVFVGMTFKDDSSGKVVTFGANNIMGVPQTVASSPMFDATNVYVRVTANMTSLDDNTDTIKLYIRWTDYAR